MLESSMALAPSDTAAPAQPSNAEKRVQQMYEEHAAMVWRGLRRLGVHEASLEDAVQDVFLVAHRRLADFKGRSSVKTWLYGIVVRVAKDHRRNQARQAHRAERLAQGLSVSSEGAPTPAGEAERREANQALHAILESLDEKQREVLIMVELEDFSIREVASALSLRVRTCQRRLQAAHAAFEKRFARYLQASERKQS
jgi:RNA polymerase sigma-70 factor (ECF subfamily)